MTQLIFCLLLLAKILGADEPEVSKNVFPVRLTPEEHEQEMQRRADAPCYETATPPYGCCTPQSDPCLPDCCKCCKPRSLNCPPLMPRFDPCDCIMDYYNPIIFNGFDLWIEALAWTVQQKSSTYALSPRGQHQPIPPPDSLADSIGEYHSAKFKWSPGFRLGLGYTFERDAWNLSGQYTYFSSGGSDRVRRPQDPTLYITATTRNLNTTNEGPRLLKSKIDFDYQTFDFFLSRRFLPGCQILFNFFAGPTAAVIDEKWKITGHHSFVTTVSQNKWSFSGGGMRVGADANWHIGSGFGLFNKVSFATLVGSYFNARKTHLSPIPEHTLAPDMRNTKESEVWVVPTTQLEFGLNWNRRFCSWAILLQGALEINTWYDLHQFHQDEPTPTNPNHNHLDYRNASPVSLWGASFRVNFSF